MLCYETDREGEGYRNNKHDFYCESGNDSFVLNSCGVYVLILFSFIISVIKILWSVLNKV